MVKVKRHLVEGLFRWHRRLWQRRSRGIVTAALSYGKDDGSAFRAHIQQDADAFVNLVALGHREATFEARKWPAAQNASGAHILVDLQGHTLGTRMELTAMRIVRRRFSNRREQAPVQVSYLIYPGTTGASFVDA